MAARSSSRFPESAPASPKRAERLRGIEAAAASSTAFITASALGEELMSAMSLRCESADTASAVSMSLHEASSALARANLSSSTRGVSAESFSRAFTSNSATFLTNFDIF